MFLICTKIHNIFSNSGGGHSTWGGGNPRAPPLYETLMPIEISCHGLITLLTAYTCAIIIIGFNTFFAGNSPFLLINFEFKPVIFADFFKFVDFLESQVIEYYTE